MRFWQVGLRPGTYAIDGAPVQGLLPAGAMWLIGNHKPGSIVNVGVTRGGTPATFKLPVTASAD